MKIVSFSIKHPVTVFMFFAAALLFGFISMSQLQLNLLPEITYPTLTISTDYPGTAPSEIENLLSKPIEEAVGVIDNVVTVSSISRAENAEVMIEFTWNTNMDYATLKVREKLDRLHLPDDADTPVILRYDPNSEPIMRVGLTADMPLGRIRYLADTEVKQALESVPGVAACTISGGLEDEIQVALDEKAMHLMNITMDQVETRLAQENINLSAGVLKEADNQYLVRTINEFRDITEIGDVIIERRGGVPVRLKHIAQVYTGSKDRDLVSRINGRECIEAAIYRAADANVVAVADRVKQRLQELRDRLFVRQGISALVITDQSHFVRKTIDEVVQAALWGGVLAVVVLLFFLKSLRSTLIISLAIPLSVVISFFLMYLFDISLNIISLGGLALGIGMLVDNSIVVLEATSRLREKGISRVQAALRGSSEVAGAVTASTITTIAVFFPIVFVKGVAGQLFKDMALTVTFSLLASLVVALTMVPMLYASGPERAGGRLQNRWLKTLFAPLDRLLQRLFAAFQKLQPYSFRKRLLILIIVLAAVVLVALTTGFMGKELIPEISQGVLTVDLEFPPGTSLAQNDRVVQGVVARLLRLPKVDTVYETVGKGTRGGVFFQEERENLSQITVNLQANVLGNQEQQVMARVREVLAQYADFSYSVGRPRLFSFNAPIEVVVTGYDLDVLQQMANRLYQDFKDIPGLRDLDVSMQQGFPELHIIMNRGLLAAQDLTTQEVGQQLRAKIAGEVPTRFIERDREVDIRVRLSEDFRNEVKKIQRLTVRNGLGLQVPLQALARIEQTYGPSEIRRIGLQRSVVLSANISDINLQAALDRINEKLAALTVPDGYAIALSGQSREKDVAFTSMLFALSLAVFLVYLVMASQFESFVKPAVIMLTIPLSIIGVGAALLATGLSINVVVLIGLVVLCGMIVNNAIVLVDYAGRLQLQGLSRMEAAVQAARVRWRPILMTAMTTILGLVPMALNRAEGFEIRLPLAATLIGGLVFGTFLTLVVIPLVYDLIAGRTRQDGREVAGTREGDADQESPV